MTTDYRALCAELNHWVVELAASHPNLSDSAITWINEVADRAVSALAQPEPVAPTDEELTLVYAYAVAAAVDNKRGPFKTEDAEAAQLAGLRAVLARYGAPANTTNQVH
jgi:hypothetical protein